ncbi:type I-B CRISPR-associated protein Cas8b1/Cst1 [Candidatus Viridilinea mediisalina]|uniref:Type I-B CRISPR-associated protein Cas8b1/Cst1 n=1 Tax=Candidatus Viridilinea mediisalina TaxID=2024553 RepID=A0A2A6RP78_9CHLR|nr:type I-B CRISPR-associated protein Cas8b1/Cst1 [Candidatus Viridilinea mediisalina]PDW04669.1 type I-B CRISPR-associated protein Cas8b1/Cst1 [Candidatus Viridilinea mediisalina]
MLTYTGHPFVDVGLAAMATYVGKASFAELTEQDFDQVARYIEANYVRPPLRGHLTMAFTANAWFIQDAFNPDKPNLTAEKRAERLKTRERWARLHVRQWEDASTTSDERCVFTGLPAAAHELSGKLQAGRVGRNQMPLLQGDEAINFFAGGDPGLPIAPQALLALQFMPLGCAKVGVGLLAVHADSEALTLAFAHKFRAQNVAAVTQMQAAGEDKLPSAPRALKTLLVEVLLEIEGQRVREQRRSETAASLTAYNFNNGKSPQLVIYHLPLQITSFLRAVYAPAYKDVWQQVVARGWQQVVAKRTKKGAAADLPPPRHNYLFEDLFTLPQQAARFIRTYFLRVPSPSRYEDDPRRNYSPQRERELITWPLVELFLKEVLTMHEERVEQIRLLGDKLADYTRRQGGKQFFRQFFTERETYKFLNLLSKTNIAYTKLTQGQDTLFDLDGYLLVFMEGDDMLRPDWRLARDLVLIRMVERLKDWLVDNPLPDETLQLDATDKEQ